MVEAAPKDAIGRRGDSIFIKPTGSRVWGKRGGKRGRGCCVGNDPFPLKRRTAGSGYMSVTRHGGSRAVPTRPV